MGYFPTVHECSLCALCYSCPASKWQDPEDPKDCPEIDPDGEEYA